MFSNRKIILTIILLLMVSLTGYVLFVIVPRHLVEQTYEGARRIGRDLKEALQFSPEIKVKEVVVLQQQREILELATLSQKFQHHYTWTNTRLYSTKKIEITGTFDAKAGFDLDEKFTIAIDGDKAVVTFPNPKLLSIESLGDMEFRDEHGVWNWIDAADRSQAINAYTLSAKAFATQADFINEANKNLEEKVLAILKIM